MTTRPTEDNETTAAVARDRAALVAALEGLVLAADHAVAAGRVAPTLAPRATGQLAKAVRALVVAPSDPTLLLIHLTAARSFLVEGWGPPALTQALSAAIARVHQLTHTTPDVFRAWDGATGAGAREATPPPRLLP